MIVGIRVEIRVWGFVSIGVIGDGVIESTSVVISVVGISLSGVISVVEISLSGVISVVEISGSIRSGVIGSINFTLGAGGVLSFVGEGDGASTESTASASSEEGREACDLRRRADFLADFLDFLEAFATDLGVLDLDLDLDLGIVINDRNTPCQRFKSVVVRGLVNKARAKADLRS